MKKIFILFAILMTARLSLYANDGKVMLQSGGKIFFFDSSNISSALSKAQDGDTIDLAKGEYSGDILISKNVLLRGVSAESTSDTYVNSNVIVSSSCELEGLYIGGNIEVKKSIKGFRIASCRFYDINFTGDMPGMLVERSWCYNILYLNNLVSKDIKFKNCKIFEIIGGSQNCSFFNCNIANPRTYRTENYWNTDLYCMINCIIEDNYRYVNSIDYRGCTQASFYFNCLSHADVCSDRGNIYYHSTDESPYLFTDARALVCCYSKEQLIEKGYLGTDGTVVGIEGGTTPFTLVPINTRIIDNSSSVDVSLGKVSVDVNVNVE